MMTSSNDLQLALEHPMAFFQTKHLWIKHLAEGVAALVLDRANSPLNFLDPPMLDDLDAAFDALTKTDLYHLLVICSGKSSNFCHGPASALVAAWNTDTFTAWAEKGQQVCRRLQELPMPSVAVIAGGCLDAGLELALACDYRVVVNKPATVLGFPELAWGMVPCWGGSQRLPHLIGLENSLQMLLGGKRFDAQAAWRAGLADHLAEDKDDTPPAFLTDPRKRDWSSFPQRSWRENWLEANRPGRWFLLRGADRILRTRIPEAMPAPTEMLQALRIVYQQPSMQPGLDFERQALHRIVEHPALHHLLRLLQHREKLRLSSAKTRIHHVGILGSGGLGLSLLLQAASKGYEVVLRTQDEATLGAALTHLMQLLQAEVQRGAISSNQFQKTLGAIRGTYTWTHFDKLDLVVDAADGPVADKLAFYEQMEKQVPAQTLLAALPQTHRVEELCSALRHPGRLLGLNILEPWNPNSVAEIVAPSSASAAAVRELHDWAASLGKYCLEIPDRLGGLVMRIWLPALNEAGVLIREGAAIQQIDQAMHRFGMTFGPLEWMDHLGVDQVAAQMAACQPEFADRLRFERSFALMVEKHWLGNHTDLGFYRQRFGRRRPHREAEQLWRTHSQGETVQPLPALSVADMHAWVQKRLVTLTILEAVRCLEEGIAKNADDLDCALCLTGWAAHRGGPIGHARQMGHAAIAAACTELAQKHGARFAPFAALKQFLA